MKIVWSRVADDDLGQIYGYYEARSLRAARRLLRHLFEAIDLLAEMPEMGRPSRYQTERDYRELVVEHYKIFYYLEQDRLVIARLWDTRQDPSRFFLPRD